MSPTAHPATSPSDREAPPSTAGRWLTLAVVSVSLLLVGLDTTVLNVALPTLVSELSAWTSELQWIVDSYLLMSGSLVLFCGSNGVAVAPHLPGDAGAAFADAARQAFVDGLGLAMGIGVGVTALGIVVALVFAPSRASSASSAPAGPSAFSAAAPSVFPASSASSPSSAPQDKDAS